MRGGGWAAALQQDPGAWTLNHAWGSGRYLAAGTGRSRHADKTLKWFGLIHHRLEARLSSSAERSQPCPRLHFRTPLRLARGHQGRGRSRCTEAFPVSQGGLACLAATPAFNINVHSVYVVVYTVCAYDYRFIHVCDVYVCEYMVCVCTYTKHGMCACVCL